MASGYMEWKGRGREEIEGLDNEQRERHLIMIQHFSSYVSEMLEHNNRDNETRQRDFTVYSFTYWHRFQVTDRTIKVKQVMSKDPRGEEIGRKSRSRPWKSERKKKKENREIQRDEMKSNNTRLRWTTLVQRKKYLSRQDYACP